MRKTLLLLAVLIYTINSQSCSLGNADKVDCGYYGINQQQCQTKGCCWVPASKLDEMIESRRLLDNIPWCFYSSGSNPCGNLNFAASSPGFDDNWFQGMKTQFEANINIQGKGGVVASPDPTTPGGSYYYHWERDGALSMRAYAEMNDYNLDVIKTKMQAYIGWVVHIQSEDDPNGVDVRIEPKFNLPDGSPYTGGWCRPQNDAPGLRATTLIYYANAMLDSGNQDNINYVKQYLWTDSAHFGGAIKHDLDWVLSGYTQNGCDLWEEIQSNDFFWNRMAHRQSMVEGAKFAQRMGDNNLYNTYTQKAQEIENTLSVHWTGSYMYESQNRQKDSSVIHAFATLNSGKYSISGPEVTGTIKTLNNLFCSEYQINQNDNAAGIPGILYGRYENDNYAGGNPWQLLTASLAEAFYQGASYMLKKSAGDHQVLLGEEEVSHWRGLLTLSEKPTALEFATAAKSAGDAVMYRIYTHVKNDGYRIDEQIDRNTGVQKSAKGLTWSYANILVALHYRNKNLAHI